MGEMADDMISHMLNEDRVFGGESDFGGGNNIKDPLFYHTHVRFVGVTNESKKAICLDFGNHITGWVPKGVCRQFRPNKQSVFILTEFWTTKRKELGLAIGGGVDKKAKYAKDCNRAAMQQSIDEAMGIFTPMNVGEQ